MTHREIEKELSRIYKERSIWDGGKGPFIESAIRRRELILVKQHVLYRIEDAKRWGDKYEESLFLKIYKIIDRNLKELGEKN